MNGPELLASAHELSEFDCGVPALTAWVRNTARHASAVGTSRTYVIHDAGAVHGYYAIATHSIFTVDAPSRLARPVRPLDSIPALLLARLAVDLRSRSRGLGEALLKHAMGLARDTAAVVGARALVADAKDESAMRFYAKFGMHPLRPTSVNFPQRVYIPIASIPGS